MAGPQTGPVASVPMLFWTCFKIGSLSFGGGLSGWIYREFVDRHRWITDEEFAANLAIAQMLPGANVVNLVIGFGELLRGPAGALACLTGFLMTPFFAVIALGAFVGQISGTPQVSAAMEGVALAAIGMLVLICGRGIARLRRNLPGLVVIAAVAGGVAGMGWPMLWVVVAVAPVSIVLAARRAGRHG